MGILTSEDTRGIEVGELELYFARFARTLINLLLRARHLGRLFTQREMHIGRVSG